MNLSIHSAPAVKTRTACLIVAIFEGRKLSDTAKQVDLHTKKLLSNFLGKGHFEGRYGQLLFLHQMQGIASERLLLVGCGPEDSLNESSFAELHQKVALHLSENEVTEALSSLTEVSVGKRNTYWRIRLAAEALQQALYRFDSLKSKKNAMPLPLKKYSFAVSLQKEQALAKEALHHANVINASVHFIKDLANLPANICTPSYLANCARTLAKNAPKLKVTVLGRKQIQTLKMGAFLAVAKGSNEPPAFITLAYTGAPKSQKPLVFVGKGITFDTGGNSLKSPTHMIGMKYDMCGAATVLGLLKAAHALNLPLNIIGLIPTCENMQSGHATRPDDIVTSMAGTTIEILNTDAEGRLILCDALHYALRYKPAAVIDIATLTGACVVALGRHATGLFSNHPPLAQALLKAGTASHDRAWSLPVWEDYVEQLKSPVADLANIGGPEASSVTAACFLGQFMKTVHWAHLDIAGTATLKNKMASGRPLPLLVQYLLDYVQAQP